MLVKNVETQSTKMAIFMQTFVHVSDIIFLFGCLIEYLQALNPDVKTSILVLDYYFATKSQDLRESIRTYIT